MVYKYTQQQYYCKNLKTGVFLFLFRSFFTKTK